MHKRLILSIFVVLLLPSLVFAAEMKVGVINMKKIMETSEPAQEAAVQLEKRFEGKEKELQQKEKELEGLAKDMETQNMMLSQEAKQNKQIEFRRKYEDFMRLRETTKKEVQDEKVKVLRPMLEILGDIVKDYGKKNNFTIVFDQMGSGILYVDEALDITDKVIVELNRAWRDKGKQ
ncbi:MAG: OmpH family outer membrane protein [Desulfovibrionales bacterium]